MLYIDHISIERAIMHRIKGKEQNVDAHCEYNDELLSLDNEIKTLLKNRIQTSFGFHSKSFELVLENDADGSTFSYLRNLRTMSDEVFIDSSKTVANILADSSNRGAIPGGFLLVLDCLYRGKVAVFVFKAEPHMALSVINHQAQALKDIILSPSQKLYKAFMMIQEGENLEKESFSYTLFDDQFASGTALARYFYQDFLGLSIKQNNIVLTKLFYDEMRKCINKTYKGDYDTKANVEDLLFSSLTDETLVINPRETVIRIVPEKDRDVFLNKVCAKELAHAFTKDTAAISNVIQNKRVDICDGIKLVGNREIFTNRVKIDKDMENPNKIIITIEAEDEANE